MVQFPGKLNLGSICRSKISRKIVLFCWSTLLLSYYSCFSVDLQYINIKHNIFFSSKTPPSENLHKLETRKSFFPDHCTQAVPSSSFIVFLSPLQTLLPNLPSSFTWIKRKPLIWFAHLQSTTLLPIHSSDVTWITFNISRTIFMPPHKWKLPSLAHSLLSSLKSLVQAHECSLLLPVFMRTSLPISGQKEDKMQ